MKIIFIVIASLMISVGFSQNGELNVHVNENGNTNFPGLAIKLINNDKILYEGQTDMDGNYTFKNIPFGIYSMKISYSGMREEIFENIKVQNEKNFSYQTYPKLCDSKRVCPKGHIKNIIPIVYGLPTKKTIKKAENEKVKLGGCTPYCEKWHCKEHNLDF